MEERVCHTECTEILKGVEREGWEGEREEERKRGHGSGSARGREEAAEAER